MRGGAPLAVLLAGTLAGCAKVPITPVAAGFDLADVSWFAEEQTLFVFYEVGAEQGLGDPSVIELSYVTDDAPLDWTALTDLPQVHTHVPVDCGARRLCGSASIAVPEEPRDVHLRLRYHRDGELALDADTVFNVVGPGPAWTNRSYLAYGVFDAANRRVQWRGRHQFPTIRNEQATELGLRRSLVVADRRYGTAVAAASDNPYGYGVDCAADFVPADLPEVATNERAVFDTEDLPLDAADASLVCADTTVTDALGTFTTTAVARKNPEVRAAFPELRSPIRDAVQVPFFLEPCERTISAEHEAMQRQRLGTEDVPSFCIDDWQSPGFRDELVVAMTDAVAAARTEGRDMVLVIGLHQDEEGVSEVVQEALAELVPGERLGASPRLAGAFVLDSDGDGLQASELSKSTLWCPFTVTGLETEDTLAPAELTCAIAPDNPSIELGPFSFGTLPILPSRSQYLDFIDRYSVDLAGEVTDLTFRTPEFATTADHVDVGDYGVATFLNEERISAPTETAFSYCVTDATDVYLFRSDFMATPAFTALVLSACTDGSLSSDVCTLALSGVLPIQLLPDWHNTFRETSYELGLGWDFPFLLHLDYQTYVTGSLTAFGLSVPFGVATNGESYLGTSMWTTDVFSLAEELTQCTRFCDHPTFDAAGVYQVSAAFRPTYADACYLPRYPVLGDSGFPLDP